MEKKNILAIIPARSGSKGLPDKNIMNFNGKPLMAYTINAARASGIFDTVHVSTDSVKYSRIAEEFGADQPFLREPKNASDGASSWDVVREVLLKYEQKEKHYQTVFLLQPTSPLRSAEDIQKAWER